MLAHHPITGQPIHILRTEIQISTDFKTLVWLRSTFQPSHRWSRWFGVVTEPDACKLSDSILAVLIGEDSLLNEWLPVLPKILEGDCFLVCPLRVANSLETHGITCSRTLLYEDLVESYPYLGEPVHPTDSYEKVIVSLAHILRMNQIAWQSVSDRDRMPFGLRSQYDAWRKVVGKGILPLTETQDDSCIPRTWLIQQYFKHASNRRSREIFNCLERNVHCQTIDHILLLNEQEYSSIPNNPKIQTVMMQGRMTYYDAMVLAKERVPPGDIVVLANADIYFDTTLSFLWQIDMEGRRLCLSLLRWEGGKDSAPVMYGPRADSQDSWIVSRNSLNFDLTKEEFGIPFGKSCCDNAFSLLMMRKKYLVVNPAYSIRTIHMHASNIRTYDAKEVEYRPHYLYVDPTAIQPCEVERNLDKYVVADVLKQWNLQVFGQSFPRIVLGKADDVKQVCGDLSWNGDNLWTPTPSHPPIYRFQNCFVTAAGLVSSFDKLCIGRSKEWQEGWEKANQSSLTPCIHVPNLISYPCDPVLCTNLSQWVLHYLPRVQKIRGLLHRCKLPVPEFLVPQIPELGLFVDDCIWGQSGNITVNPIMTDMNYYADVAWSVPPFPTMDYVTREDIQILRSLQPQAKRGLEPVAVFCVEDDANAVLTRDWAEEVAERVLRKGWTVYYVSVSDTPLHRRKAFQAASWIFGTGQALDWMWYAQPGTTVLEFVPVGQTVVDHIHLAGAAGVSYIVNVLQPNELPFQKQAALMEIGRAIQTHGFSEMLQTVRANPNVDIPKIVLPTGRGLTGLWSHCGDTFREMAALWAERNYVRLETSEETHFCWWGGIGEVLLYDRPTPRWWFDLPPYQMALFGNCPPPGPDTHRLRQSVWCFWGRRPQRLEDMHAKGQGRRGWNERSIASLFLGKVENGIQHANRCTHDWSSSVELFSMPIESSAKPYPFTHEEYLQKLCLSRYGLCLAGFGAKCNREIEYFATGCVPIVTDGVDMKHYLVPPKEGVHYFRASCPEDVRRIVSETTAEKWSEMSLAGREWWRMFASAEGFFRLTWSRIEQCRPYLHVGIPLSFPATM